MFKTHIYKILLGSLLVIALVPFFAPIGNWFWAKGNDGSIALKPPPFVSTVYAEGEAIDASFVDEVGIAEYVNVGQTIDLTNSTLRSLFRTIETEKTEYIIGSVPVEDYTNDHDVKVYVSKNGWVMSYYHRVAPVSKIFDWVHYDGGSAIPTKLDRVLNSVVNAAGASFSQGSYYHFAYPNANTMTLIAERASVKTETFNLTLPSTFQYFERSWSINTENGCSWAILFLNTQEIGRAADGCRWAVTEGLFSTNLEVNKLHTIGVQPYGESHGGIALIYKVQ